MLRVFLAGPPQPDRADPWVRHGADDRAIAHGRDVPAQWPTDATIEAVLAAGHVRLAALKLPPMPRNRVRAAARFALEDQMAASTDDVAIAVVPADTQGACVAALASAATIRAIAASPKRIARIVPESALAPRYDGWTWCASADGGGFVRRADGSAFAVGAAENDAVPSELAAALAQAQRMGNAPSAVHAALPGVAARVGDWSRSTGVRFVAATAWDWQQATRDAFAAAPDFLADDSPAVAPSTSGAMRLFRPALVLASVALAVHVGALFVQWAWLSFADWRLAREQIEHAKAAGVSNATSVSTAADGIAHRNAELRHRALKNASSDALPLLARAAPSIAALPGGALKSATYANGAWIVELGKVDGAALSQATRALGNAGVDAVSAPTAGGTRMRLTLDSAAR